MNKTALKLDAIRKLLEMPTPQEEFGVWREYPKGLSKEKEGYVIGIYEKEGEYFISRFATSSRIGQGYGEYKPLYYLDLNTFNGKPIKVRD